MLSEKELTREFAMTRIGLINDYAVRLLPPVFGKLRLTLPGHQPAVFYLDNSFLQIKNSHLQTAALQASNILWLLPESAHSIVATSPGRNQTLSADL